MIVLVIILEILLVFDFLCQLRKLLPEKDGLKRPQLQVARLVVLHCTLVAMHVIALLSPFM